VVLFDIKMAIEVAININQVMIKAVAVAAEVAWLNKPDGYLTADKGHFRFQFEVKSQ